MRKSCPDTTVIQKNEKEINGQTGADPLSPYYFYILPVMHELIKKGERTVSFAELLLILAPFKFDVQ